MRIRTSTSFAIDLSPPTDEKGEENPETSFNRYHKTGGIVGSCSSNPYETDLWHFGTCDSESTVAFDMEIVSPSDLLGERANTCNGDETSRVQT